MATVSRLAERLQHRVDEVVARRQVAGCALAVSIGGETVVVVSGVQSLRTGVPLTRDSIFAIGSITKVYEATLLLLTLGVDLDDPVRRHLPEFRTTDMEQADAITFRQLLTHSDGLEADYFPELGWGDDAVERYVEGYASLGHIHPPGLFTSYSNSGVVLGGRALEVALGCTWDDALRRHILEPAGFTDTVSLPWEAATRPIAIGHLPGPDGSLQVVPQWSWPRASSPCGGTLAASAPEVLAFARLHLDRAAPVAPVAEAMTQLQRPWHEGSVANEGAPSEGMGLGWFAWDWNGTRVLGHDGSGMGCANALRVVPEHDAIVVCLVNSWFEGYAVDAEVVRGVLQDEVGLSFTDVRVPVDPGPAERYVGTYARLGAELQVVEGADGALAVVQPAGDPDDLMPSTPSESLLEPIGPDLFVGRTSWWPLEHRYRFVDSSGGGNADYLFEGIRVHRRTSQ